jgi:hypothetical protein
MRRNFKGKFEHLRFINECGIDVIQQCNACTIREVSRGIISLREVQLHITPKILVVFTGIVANALGEVNSNLIVRLQCVID